MPPRPGELNLFKEFNKMVKRSTLDSLYPLSRITKGSTVYTFLENTSTNLIRTCRGNRTDGGMATCRRHCQLPHMA